MKEFVKTMLAVICGIIVWGIIRFIFFLILLGSATAGSGTPAMPKSGGVLNLDFSSFTLSEQTQENSMPDFSSLSFSSQKTIGLRDAILALQEAATDPAVNYVYLRADEISGGTATLEEFRGALAAFRESGKAVVAYTENPGNGSYYIASAADKVWMGSQHGGTYQLIGLSSTLTYFKDILDKLGVNVQLIRHGKYKSAGETFIRSSASPENREQYQVLLNSIWKCYAGAIAASRSMSEEQFNQLLDNLSLVVPEDFLSSGLVDELVDHQTLQDKLCTLAQVDDIKKLHLVSFPDYVAAKVSPNASKNKVAVIYADGEIADGDATSGIAGDRFVRIIDKVRKDKNVKAVVLRVNSPGGSVSASVKIRTALDLLQQEKPLVASYGNYAASGGYWISNGCQKIYSDAATITGSIGVFSMIPEFSKVTKKVGVGVESVNTNKHSDMFTLMRPFDKEEMAYMQASIEDIYEMFVNLVAQSRGMEPAQVDAIAQGRVWSGTDALQIGLVDEIGTLEDAIRYAASLADFTSSDEYTVTGYPTPPSAMEQIMEQFGGSQKDILSGTPFEGMGQAVQTLKAGNTGLVMARLPYALDIR